MDRRTVQLVGTAAVLLAATLLLARAVVPEVLAVLLLAGPAVLLGVALITRLRPGADPHPVPVRVRATDRRRS